MHPNRTEFPMWNRIGSIVGLTTIVMVIACSAYQWLDTLEHPLYEVPLYALDAVSVGDMAIFAASLIMAGALYAPLDPDLWRSVRTTLRRASSGIRWALHAHVQSVDQNPEEHARRRSLQPR